MSDYHIVKNMLRNFEQIDKEQPKVEFVPSEGDYVLLIDGKSDGYVYHHTSVVEFINCGYALKPDQEFRRMTELTVDEMLYFLNHRK
jgi:hypothetical protein